MTLVRWEPVRELSSLQNEVNRLFGSFFDLPKAEGNGGLRKWIPSMDIVETDNHFVVKTDLPGVSEENISVELEDNVLTISGNRAEEHEDKREGYYRVERSFGQFSRTLTLPEGIDPESIEASFDRGVLEVRIPKPEGRKPRKVSIDLKGQSQTIEGKESEASSVESEDTAQSQ